MKADNMWPNTENYTTLTVLATSATTEENEDNKTDLYVPPLADVPFSVPHLYPTLYALAPSSPDFPYKSTH